MSQLGGIPVLFNIISNTVNLVVYFNVFCDIPVYTEKKPEVKNKSFNYK